MSRENSAVNLRQAFSIFLIASLVIDDAYAKPPSRLIGGSDAQLGEIVFQASLRLNGKHYCGGTLISTRHVLTAAHCVAFLKSPYQELTAVTGTINLAQGGTTYRIADIDVHEKFTTDDDDTWHNDIAVLTLDGDVEINTYQSPTGLPDYETPAHVVGLVSGWGYKDYEEYPDGDFSVMLQKADMTTLSNDECQARHKSIIDYEQICGYKDNFSGICKGDGGSPLMVNNSVVGISSWYYPCALGLPDVYTRVFHYLHWILEVMSASFYDELEYDDDY